MYSKATGKQQAVNGIVCPQPFIDRERVHPAVGVEGVANKSLLLHKVNSVGEESRGRFIFRSHSLTDQELGRTCQSSSRNHIELHAVLPNRHSCLEGVVAEPDVTPNLKDPGHHLWLPGQQWQRKRIGHRGSERIHTGPSQPDLDALSPNLYLVVHLILQTPDQRKDESPRL